jgi:hypothetical protein
MAIKPYYTSNTLIEAVKRKMAFPISQVTFSNEDILRFADEEMMLAQVPSILQFHEEYFVHTQEVALVPGKSRYPIPSRAIGMKLRDLFFKDTQGQLIEMSKVNPDDRALFQAENSVNPNPVYYYVENNSIILVPEVSQNPQGSLVFSYYLRPNSLVTDDKAAICSSFSKTITFDNSNLVAGDSVTVDQITAIAGTDFAIGTNSSITATNFTSYLNSLSDPDFTATVAGSICTITYISRSVKVSSSSAGMIVQSSLTINCPSVPSEITGGKLVDFLQAEAGHSTYSFDVKLPLNAVSGTTITLSESLIPADFVPGDYICLQYECIIPQVPTDLHNLLAERTCARILEALGDQAGLQTANAKIRELEGSQAMVLDNRVEGSPQKVLNRHSLLRYGKIRRGR